MYISRFSMYVFLVILCTATVLLHGVSCQPFPRAIFEQVTNTLEVHKRQNADAAEMAQQCVLERFDSIYQGNNSRLVTECRSVALLQEGLNPSDGQAYINTRFRTLCIPGCGNVLLDVYDECGAFISPHERSLMASICSYNRNGDYCYEFLLETRILLAIAARCTIDRSPFYDALTCNCSAISEGAEKQGCCYADISNNFINLWKAIGFVGDLTWTQRTLTAKLMFKEDVVIAL